MLRIVHIINGLGVGGGERLLQQLLLRLDRDRFSSTVYCLTREGSIADELRSRGVTVRRLTWEGAPNPLAWTRLARDLSRADVVHTHFYYSDLVGSVLGRIMRVPRRVTTRHDTGYWMDAAHAWIEPWIYGGFDRVACVSDAVRDGLMERGVSTAGMCILPPGIPDAVDEVVAPTLAAPYVLAVGRLEPVKGQDILVRAFADVASDLRGWKLVLVGDGSERHQLESLAQKIGVAARCRFVGELPVAKVRALMKRAGLFVLPSHSEALPLSLLEGMQAGLPCIATRVGGNAEVIDDGVDGVLVPPGDVETMAEAILALARDRDAAAGLGAAAQRKVEQRFSIAAFVEATERLYAG